MQKFNKKIYDEFGARGNDYINTAIKNEFCLTKFLNVNQRELLQNMCKKHNLLYAEWGGYEDAQYKKVVLSTFEYPCDNESFELSVITSKIRFNNSQVGHKDVLGTVFGLGVTHDVFGDIVLDDKEVNIVVNTSMQDMFMMELTKIKKEPMKFVVTNKELVNIVNMEEKVIKVNSPRMDHVISKLYNIKRSDANKLIMSGNVLVNFVDEKDVSKKLTNNDRVSVRGHGLFFVTDINTNHKDECVIIISKVV